LMRLSSSAAESELARPMTTTATNFKRGFMESRLDCRRENATGQQVTAEDPGSALPYRAA
jgi:hypothetical protein